MNVTAIKELLYKMADDLLIIGHRNSEWTGLGPILEEDIAFSSMAQDKIGQAGALFEILHELGEGEPDTVAFMRDANKMHCSQFVELPNGESEVVNFLKREFEPKGLDPIWFEEYFSWKVGPLNPGGKGYLFVVYASGKVLACLSLTVKKALFNGQEIKTAEFGDAYCSNLFFENIKFDFVVLFS
mgnify:CR=1 FL=1